MQIVQQLDDLEDIEKELKYLQNYYVIVGIIDEDAETEGVKIVFYASVNEYGTKDGRIPARPFFRYATQSSASEKAINAFMEAEGQKVMLGEKTGKQALTATGLYVKGRIQDSIKNGPWKPNAKSTIEGWQSPWGTFFPGKGKNNPLLHKGDMIRNIDFEIVRK